MGKQKSHQTTAVNGLTMDPEAVHREIRKRAYELYLECGCEYGHDERHWLEAEAQMCARPGGETAGSLQKDREELGDEAG